MRRLLLLMTVLAIAIAPYAQTKRTTANKARTTKTTKNTKKKTTAKKKKTTSISGLKNERAQIKKQIKAQEQKLRTNEKDVKKRLQNLMVINSEISDKQKTIDTIKRDIAGLEHDITVMNRQIRTMEKELADRKDKFVKSMRYMHRNRSIQNQLMFVFSAKNFTQMYRRMRFMREYATYQKAQGELVKQKQKQLTAKRNDLQKAKDNKHSLLARGEQEQKSLEDRQNEQKKVVNSLKRQQKTILALIDKQKKKNEELDAEIDRLVAIEVEKARQRAIAEAKRRAEQEAAKKRAAELARKKAQAEAEAKANAKRIAEAKAKEQRLREQAKAARSQKEREEAARRIREAESERKKAERNAADNARKRNQELAKAKKENDEFLYDNEDRRLSGTFLSNKGRLPMPVEGGYRIVSHFGQYNVKGLSNVRLDNKGITIMTQPGAKVRSIYDGVVTYIFDQGASFNGILIRHGNYISVYSGLSSISVRTGQKVSTRQAIGTVGSDNTLIFQLRNEKTKLNPEAWLGK